MEKSNPNYIQWKQKYELEKKQDQKKLFTRGVLVFGGIIFISAFIYFWASGNFQFLGKETQEVQASSIVINDYHIGRGNYIPRVTIKYMYLNKEYTTYKNITDASKHAPKYVNGNIYVSAFVVFDIDNPKNCKVRLVYN